MSEKYSYYYRGYYYAVTQLLLPEVLRFYETYSLPIQSAALVALFFCLLSKRVRVVTVWMVTFALTLVTTWYIGIQAMLLGEEHYASFRDAAVFRPNLWSGLTFFILSFLLIFGIGGFWFPTIPTLVGVKVAKKAARWVGKPRVRSIRPRQGAGRPSLLTVLWVQLLSLITFHWVFEW